MYGAMHSSPTNEGATTMTDQATLHALITDAEVELQGAIRWAATTDLHAPLAMKVKDQERIDLARIELDALRELEPEG
jgi:hypothetical protein